MGRFFDFEGEDGVRYRVIFEVLEAARGERRYGIRAKIFQDEILVDQAEAQNRFFTREEAMKAVSALCRFQVTPCTLCDII